MLPSAWMRTRCISLACAATLLCGGCQFFGIDRREDIAYVTEKERKKVVEPMYSVKVNGTNLYKQWPVRRGVEYGVAPWERRGDQQVAVAPAIVGPGGVESNPAATNLAATNAANGGTAKGGEPSASELATAQASKADKKNAGGATLKKPSSYGRPEEKAAAADPRLTRHAPGDVDNDAAVLAAAAMGAERPPVWKSEPSNVAAGGSVPATGSDGTRQYTAAELAALRPPRAETEFDSVADQIANAGEVPAEDTDLVQASDFEEPAAAASPASKKVRIATEAATQRERLPWRSNAPEPEVVATMPRSATAPASAVGERAYADPAPKNHAAAVSPVGGFMLQQPASVSPKARAVVMSTDNDADANPEPEAAHSTSATQPIARKIAAARTFPSAAPMLQLVTPRAMPAASSVPPSNVRRDYSDVESRDVESAEEESDEEAVVMASDVVASDTEEQEVVAPPHDYRRGPIAAPAVDADGGEQADKLLDELEAAKRAVLPY